MKSLIQKVFWLFVLCSGIALAINKTPTGFYYPLESIQASDCGKWLGRDKDNHGCYTQGFYHLGQDLSATLDESVYPIADGTVIAVSKNGWTSCKVLQGDVCTEYYLNEDKKKNIAVLVQHKLSNGKKFLAVYGHIHEGTNVSKDDQVYAGKTELGKIGYWSNGIHLHFSILSPVGLGVDIPSYSKLGRAGNADWLKNGPQTFGQEDP